MSDIIQDDEISLADILGFLQAHWATIAGTGVAGLLAAGGFLAAVPAKYEAQAMIEMTQIRGGGLNGAVSLNPIEPASLLIERLKNPTAYTPEAIQACAGDAGKLSAAGLAGLVKASIPRNISHVIEIKVRRATPALAQQCAQGLFEMIRLQQAALVKPHQDEIRRTLEGLVNRFTENQNYVLKTEKAGLYNVMYLARRDETMYLIQQIDELQRALARDAQARLVSPTYATPDPVSPKTALTLALGALGGLMAGLLYALGRRVLRQQRSAA
ncbi:MAG: hypothetical protein RIS88_143 [Pseudomonadota bacterium]